MFYGNRKEDGSRKQAEEGKIVFKFGDIALPPTPASLYSPTNRELEMGISRDWSR